ncbi:MAG: UDP-N-acetylmuramoyl-tripeptide--D-alanyl-D-alanine ligase [Ruminococcaceae bacterium]|nr:UDP-N-acetylmuramoyl-tripeptide--D-alanyl-D-alanine ligase [Oscillospiraceae bacterium]
MEITMKIKLGREKMSLRQFAALCSGEPFGCAETEFSYICTDSREADPNTLFVAIRGERVDGHAFIGSAKALGARCVLCERKTEDGISGVIVNDSVGALIKAAENSPRPERTVAITGSVGKTTTKEFTAAALSPLAPYKTEGNFNSVIGLPLSMLEISPSTHCAVLEMGMSGFSEIEAMSRAARPCIAIITNIGSSHMELLGSRENIRKAKLEIVSGLTEDGILLINGDDPMLMGYETGVRTMSVGVENRECDFFAKDIKQESHGTSFVAVFPDKTRESCYISQFGEHNVRAALFGLAAAHILGIDHTIAKNGVAAFNGTKMRQNIYRVGEYTFVEDCYNASPESMRAALCVASSLGGRLVSVLGDMKELGETEKQLHYEVGEYAAKNGTALLFSYGELAENIAAGAEAHGVKTVRMKGDDPERAAELISSQLLPGDTVLFKASRAMREEKIIEILKRI